VSVERQAYSFEVRCTALGDQPVPPRKVTPEATEALFAAVDAFKAKLREHGFQVAHTGSGVRGA
jgi:hypothetical protein